MKSLLATATLATALVLTQISATATRSSMTVRPVEAARQEVPEVTAQAESSTNKPEEEHSVEPKTVLMRTGHWFVYPRGCQTVEEKRDVVVHFHGAHTTVIPRFLASKLDAVLVIINKGIGSGAYSNALAIDTQVDNLVNRIEESISEHCDVAKLPIDRLALSSWSAGYGATEQFLRLRPELVDAVLLADGLHVGFTDKYSRKVNADRLDVFLDFARRAGRGERLMAVTHSSIKPADYAGAGETAQVLSDAAHAPIWPTSGSKYGMEQLTASRRGQFYSEGFTGNQKKDHAAHLYAIGRTSFARLRTYWKG